MRFVIQIAVGGILGTVELPVSDRVLRDAARAHLAGPVQDHAVLRHNGGVVALLYVFYYLLFFFWLLLIGRIVIELVRSFARQWVPGGPSAVALELMFTATDPPLKVLRRVIPVVRIGGVGLDLSIMVLLLVVFILMNVAQSALP